MSQIESSDGMDGVERKSLDGEAPETQRKPRVIVVGGANGREIASVLARLVGHIEKMGGLEAKEGQPDLSMQPFIIQCEDDLSAHPGLRDLSSLEGLGGAVYMGEHRSGMGLIKSQRALQAMLAIQASSFAMSEPVMGPELPLTHGPVRKGRGGKPRRW